MKKYEVMYIIRPTVEKEAIASINQKFAQIFSAQGSKVLETKEIGLKDLAYEIDHHKKGYYMWLLVESGNDSINEFNRVVRITEEVIRFIVIKEGE